MHWRLWCAVNALLTTRQNTLVRQLGWSERVGQGRRGLPPRRHVFRCLEEMAKRKKKSTKICLHSACPGLSQSGCYSKVKVLRSWIIIFVCFVWKGNWKATLTSDALNARRQLKHLREQLCAASRGGFRNVSSSAATSVFLHFTQMSGNEQSLLTVNWQKFRPWCGGGRQRVWLLVTTQESGPLLMCCVGVTWQRKHAFFSAVSSVLTNSPNWQRFEKQATTTTGLQRKFS